MTETNEELPFNILFKKVKALALEKMKKQKTGTVIVPISEIEGYFSDVWIKLFRHKLERELSEEFGIQSVTIQNADPQHEVETAFIIS